VNENGYGHVLGNVACSESKIGFPRLFPFVCVGPHF
jgi:hypothetical protein